MTPLIDVMLVLLVIFMITAPLMSSSLKLDLPKAPAGQADDSAPSVALAIDAQGRLFLAEKPIDRLSLAQALKAKAQRQPQIDVLLRADRRVPYGDVATLIALVQDAGLSRIGFVTEAPTDTAPTPAPVAQPARPAEQATPAAPVARP